MVRFHLFLGALLLSLTAHGALFHDPALNWYTLQSEHFRLHYHSELEGLAPEVLRSAERVHERWSRYLDWQPTGRTDIVLTDEYDFSNGFATSFPSKRMTLFVTPPDQVNSLEDHNGWLELVLEHEYIHVLHLDKSAGTPGALRSAFGRFPLLLPNIFQPAWFIEGIATYGETHIRQGIGRGQSSYYAMLMRGELEGGIKPLRQINQPITSWPLGTVPYLYGVHFYQFIDQEYGENWPAHLINQYSDNLIPFRINGNSEDVLGQDLDLLWPRFADYLRQRYPDAKVGPERGARLTGEGYYTESPVIDRHNDILFTHYDARRRMGLFRYQTEQQTVERIADLTGEARIAIAGDKVVISQLTPCRNAAVYADLFRLEGDELQRLTRCGRYRYGLPLEQGGIIAVHNSSGRSALHRLDDQGRFVAQLWQGGEGEVLATPTLSPSGDELVAVRWVKGRGWDLARFNIETRQWRWLTDTTAIEATPSYSRDGRWIYYSADYGGRYELYRMDLDRGEVEALGIGDAFSPQTGNDYLVFRGYSAEGYDLYRVAHAELKGEPFALPQRERADLSEAVAQAQTSSVTGQPYTPWSSVTPQWWFPNFILEEGRSEVGLITSASDALDRHTYALDFSYDFDNEWFVGGFDYLYDRGPLLWHLSVNDDYLFQRASGGEVVRIDRTRDILAEAIYPLYGGYNRLLLRGGVVSEGEESVAREGVAALDDYHDTLGGFGLQHDSTVAPPRATGLEDGWRNRLYLERHDLMGDSDYRGAVVHGQLERYLGLGPGTLQAGLAAGYGEDGSQPFQLGGGSGSDLLASVGVGIGGGALGKRQFVLRGYKEGLPELTGSRFARLQLAYRQPLWVVERGIMAPPVALDRFHLGLFAETGSAWRDGSEPKRFHPAAGMELYSDLYAFYSVPVRLTLGVARGFADSGESQVYLRLSGGL